MCVPLTSIPSENSPTTNDRHESVYTAEVSRVMSILASTPTGVVLTEKLLEKSAPELLIGFPAMSRRVIEAETCSRASDYQSLNTGAYTHIMSKPCSRASASPSALYQ